MNRPSRRSAGSARHPTRPCGDEPSAPQSYASPDPIRPARAGMNRAPTRLLTSGREARVAQPADEPGVTSSLDSY